MPGPPQEHYPDAPPPPTTDHQQPRPHTNPSPAPTSPSPHHPTPPAPEAGHQPRQQHPPAPGSRPRPYAAEKDPTRYSTTAQSACSPQPDTPAAQRPKDPATRPPPHDNETSAQPWHPESDQRPSFHSCCTSAPKSYLYNDDEAPQPGPPHPATS